MFKGTILMGVLEKNFTSNFKENLIKYSLKTSFYFFLINFSLLVFH